MAEQEIDIDRIIKKLGDPELSSSVFYELLRRIEKIKSM